MPTLQVDRFTPVVEYVVGLLRDPVNRATLGIQNEGDIYYGDQDMIPRTPAIAVEAGTYTRSLSGIGAKGRTDNNIRLFLICYVDKIQSVEQARKEADELSERVMDILHKDVTLGENVIHGFVTTIEPGYAFRGGTLMRAARISWEGLTKTLIA